MCSVSSIEPGAVQCPLWVDTVDKVAEEAEEEAEVAEAEEEAEEEAEVAEAEAEEEIVVAEAEPEPEPEAAPEPEPEPEPDAAAADAPGEADGAASDEAAEVAEAAAEIAFELTLAEGQSEEAASAAADSAFESALEDGGAIDSLVETASGGDTDTGSQDDFGSGTDSGFGVGTGGFGSDSGDDGGSDGGGFDFNDGGTGPVITETRDDTVVEADTGPVAVAQAPDLDVTNVLGQEDTAIPIPMSAGLADTDGAETLSVVTISGVPEGATLSAGSRDADTGDWTVDAADLAGLTLTPPDDFSGAIDLQASVTATEADDSTATTTADFVVNVAGVADAADLTVADVTGAEDAAIPLSISSSFTDTDGSEQMAVTISGVPDGATLHIFGTDITFEGASNEITVYGTSGEFSDLSITPSEDSSDDFSLNITAVTAEDGTTATASASLAVTVTGVADEPVVTVQDVAGAEDTSFDLDLAAQLGDIDGSESMTITIDGVPEGSTLSGGSIVGGESDPILTGGTDGDTLATQTWELSVSDLSDLTITPPADYNGAFSMQVTATATEEGTTATTIESFQVTVDPVNDEPVAIDVTASTDEDTDLSGSLTATDADVTESLTYTVAEGGEATQGTATVNSDGSYTYDIGDELQSLAVGETTTDSFTYQVDDGEGGTTTATVTIIGTNDGPVAVTNMITGTEDAHSLTGSLSALDVDASDV